MIEECLVVEFAVTGDDCPLAEATETVGTTVHCDPPLYRRNDTALLRFSADEKSDELADTLSGDDRIDYLHVSDGDHGTNFRCLSEQFCVTPAQEEALRAALEMEYIAVPRAVTARDVADELEISKSVFLERLQRGEYHVLSRIFGRV